MRLQQLNTDKASRLYRQIQNSNRQISKCYEHHHSAVLRTQTILGTHNTLQLPVQFSGSEQFNTFSGSTSGFTGISNLNGFVNSSKPSASIISLNEEQLLYYTCRYFIIYNLQSKEYQMISRDVRNHVMRKMKKFSTMDKDKKLIVAVYEQEDCDQGSDGLVMGLLTIKTDYEARTSRNDGRCEWKVVRVGVNANGAGGNVSAQGKQLGKDVQCRYRAEDSCYYPKKNLLYLVVTKYHTVSSSMSSNSQQQSFSNFSSKSPFSLPSQQSFPQQQYLLIYDLTKEIMLINQEIKSNTVGFFIEYLVLQSNEVLYMVGRNYFRQWTVNFNEKVVRESNVRNVERVLKGKQIVELQEIDRYTVRQGGSSQVDNSMLIGNTLNNNALSISTSKSTTAQKSSHISPAILTQPSKLLLILTQSSLLIIKSNQLIASINPEQSLSKQSRSKDNIEKQLENSFNQIHKMKFLFDEYEELKEKQSFTNNIRKSNNLNQDGIKQTDPNDHTLSSNKFTAMSKVWKTQNNTLYFAISNLSNSLLIYELIDYQIKLYTQFPITSNSPITSILPTQSGDILLCLTQSQQLHLINQENYNPDDEESSSKSLWGNGQLHAGRIVNISSPMVQNVMATVGEDGTFKLWSMKKNQRAIIFEEKSNARPLGISIHPSGMIVAVNFEKEIKLFAILPKEFYEVTSVKTNYPSLELQYSHKGEFLVSNEGSVLIMYEPFSLKVLGYLQLSDMKHKITKFTLTSNSESVCFTTQDNSAYFHSLELSELSSYEHISPSHRQSEPYTAFWFDFVTVQNPSSKNPNNSPGSEEKKTRRNVFVGATKSKYLVIYEDFGQRLVAEYPVDDCFIVDLVVWDRLMVCGTSKGTLRVYNWPILEEELELEIVSAEHGQIRYKPPQYVEYSLWHPSICLQSLHKLKFAAELVVSSTTGNLAVLSFTELVNKKPLYEEISPERKKMSQLLNQMFYIKRSETEKRNKLIEKTENDILKVENEILREKIQLERKMDEQEKQVEKGFRVKGEMQEGEKMQYMSKEKNEIEQLKQMIEEKKTKLSELKQHLTQDYEQKKLYEQSRNSTVQEQIHKVILEHKAMIKAKIESHKKEITAKKKEYFEKVRKVQDEFEKEVIQVYQAKARCNNEGERKESGLLGNLVMAMAITGSGETCDDKSNEKIGSLIHKLEQIESSNNNHLITDHEPQSHYNFSNITSQPVIQHSPNDQTGLNVSTTTKSNPTGTKLKRSGIPYQYQFSQKSYLRKKQHQLKTKKEQERQEKEREKHRLMEEEFSNEIMEEMMSQENEDILIQGCRVEELIRHNHELEQQIVNLQNKISVLESEDEELQKSFQQHLESYNLSRFTNLNLHCQVLKMQNQLIERKQVLDNKEEIVMLAYQEKEKLENYKQLVKGSLSKLQSKKQQMRQVFFKKENDLAAIFSQLVNEIGKMEKKKTQLKGLQRKLKENQKELKVKEGKVGQVVDKLKDIKKYLLLQRMNEDKSQKSIYTLEQSLLSTINFLKKRLYMQSLKQKKNKQLKKSSLNQILKQNKNLLEQCNQLRSEGIQYENEIRNLSNKLKEANKMITIETKLKAQKNDVSEQKNQLEIIRKLFKMQLGQFTQEGTGQDSPGQVDEGGNAEEKKVYFDSEKGQSSFAKIMAGKQPTVTGNKVVFNNFTNAFSLNEADNAKPDSKDHTEYKPFKLSKYIEAEPFDRIVL